MDATKLLGKRSVDALCRIAEILKTAGTPFAAVGASAFLLHGIDLRRTTRDLDLAVAIEGGLTAIRPLLLEADLTSTGIEHRFCMPDGSEIDVLAVDPSASPPFEIRLSDEDRIRAVGLPEGIRHAAPIPIDDCHVPLAPLCLLIANKLCGATSVNRPYDLDDACAAMEMYEASGDAGSRSTTSGSRDLSSKRPALFSPDATPRS